MTRLVVNTAAANEQDEEDEEEGAGDGPDRALPASAADIAASRLLVKRGYGATVEALAPAARAAAVAAFAEGKVAPPSGQAAGHGWELACVDQGLVTLLEEAEDGAAYAKAGLSWAPHI
jgi:hypothetical protein